MDDRLQRILSMDRCLPITFFIMWLCMSTTAMAEISVARVFNDHMVLQRDQPLSIWGWGTPGERLTITVHDKQFKGKVAKDGSWSVPIGGFPAGGPYVISIDGTNHIELQDVLFGEVWLCSGQSNMQYTLKMLGKDIDLLDRVDNDQIRMLSVEISGDLLPARDIKGGEWQPASKQTVPDFSATAYYFGKLLYDSLQVPVGLVNASLGATTIETWMSNQALKAFPQFAPVIAEREAIGKNITELDADLAAFRKTWDSAYYRVGPGFDGQWYDPELDDTDWATITNPNFWEYEGLDHDGAVWYRKAFDLPAGVTTDHFTLRLNQIDDYDITWVNGEQVGETFGNRNWRNYEVPVRLLRPTGNQVTVRVFDIGGLGGMHTSAFWGNPVLNGEWKYKAGLSIDPTSFPQPQIANGSLFSYPGLLYNANIAPLTRMVVKGVVWYQGESNAARAAEYGSLLPAMIRDWRHQWSTDLPFLIVQLANYGSEPRLPSQSNWAELRAAQASATRLDGVAIATAIDIGEADDIHPHNKETLGQRLGWLALDRVYDWALMARSPRWEAMHIVDGQALLSISNEGSGLHTNDKYGYIRGFQIAGEDKQFYWARAELREGQLIVASDDVPHPIAVRYAWSDNPGPLDLYNSAGLPLLPFRTDDWPLGTAGKVYDNTPHQF